MTRFVRPGVFPHDRGTFLLRPIRCIVKPKGNGMPSILNAFGIPSPTAIVGGGLVAAMVLTAAWGSREDHLRAKHAAELHIVQAKLQAESNAHDATLSSLSGCLNTVDRNNAAADARAKADADRLAKYNDQIAKLQKDAQASGDKIQRLKGMADHANAAPVCKAPQALLNELDGL